MSKHIVFLIHGIGRHSPDWAKAADGPIEALKAASKQYAFFQNGALEEHVEFAPLYYDDIMDVAISKWRGEDPTALSAGADMLPGLQSIGTWLGSVPDDAKEIFWSHAADIGIYRLLPPYRQRIRTQLIEAMAQKLEAAYAAEGTSPQCTVVAHSLGTTVAHDVIHALGATRWGGEDNPHGPRHWRFNAIFMLANTSRFLAAEHDPYQSIVRPGPSGSLNSYCSRFFNVRHKLDPVPVPNAFGPSDWGDDFRIIELDHFREVNVHGFAHHLLHPKVHVPLLRTIVNPGAVTRDEAALAQSYPQWDMPRLKGELQQRLSQELAGLVETLKARTQINEVLEGITSYYRVVREINGALSA